MKNLSKRDKVLVKLTGLMVIYMIVGLIAKNVFHIDSYLHKKEPQKQVSEKPVSPKLFTDEDTDSILINKSIVTIVEQDTTNDCEEKAYNLTLKIKNNQIISVKLEDK